MMNGKSKSDQEKSTKEMSSDTKKVAAEKQTPPPQGTGASDPRHTKDDSSDAEAQKGHA
ncbi:hypothetical protein [Pontibacter sp. HSC-36F09]|uniref:hypothetical protein n=1 Tax=Pontibacter sp. HSC-36F09 TaxID=2910966 RepID=UPI0020A08472|nr:hypothetical protein [Pontibacter sp. HSC-36F09]MCP2042522.1 hypothetical protein [Pontibacter sp. HSC-36F09]